MEFNLPRGLHANVPSHLIPSASPCPSSPLTLAFTRALGFRKSPLLPQPIFSPHANTSTSNDTMVMPKTTVPVLSWAPACMPCYPQIPPFGWFLDKHLKRLPFPYSPTYFPFGLPQPSKWHLQFPTETRVSVLPPTSCSPPTSNQVLSTVPPEELSNSPAPCCLLPGSGPSLFFLEQLQ